MPPSSITITDRGDPRIAPYVSIRERDLTGGSDGRFIVEGKVPLTILLTRSRFAIDSVFICDSRLEPLAEVLETVPPGVPVYSAAQNVMDSIAGFPMHRGVLACAHKKTGMTLAKLLDSEPGAAKTVLVLNDLSNHDNVGAAFRNAAAFGADGILLDERSCDPLYRKSIRVSSGSALWLPYHQGGSGIEHIAALKKAGFEIWAMTPNLDAAPLQTQKIRQKLAILLGAEGNGLPETLISAANPVRIPMLVGMDSINVATAGAVALAHVFAARQGS